MGLIHREHRRQQHLEEELRALWRHVDRLSLRENSLRQNVAGVPGSTFTVLRELTFGLTDPAVGDVYFAFAVPIYTRLTRISYVAFGTTPQVTFKLWICPEYTAEASASTVGTSVWATGAGVPVSKVAIATGQATTDLTNRQMQAHELLVVEVVSISGTITMFRLQATPEV